MKLTTLVRSSIVILVCALAVGLLSIANYSIDQSYTHGKTLLLEKELELTHLRLNLQLRHYQNEVLSLSEHPSVSGIVNAHGNEQNLTEGLRNIEQWKKQLQQVFASHIKYDNAVLQLRMLRAEDGMELVRVDLNHGNTEHPKIVEDKDLQSKLHRSYVTKSLNLKKGEIYMSPINLNQENGRIGTPHISTARVLTPVFNEQGQLFGLIALNLNTSKMLELFRSAHSEDCSIVLYDSKGDFLIHPTRAMEFGSDLGQPNLVAMGLREIIPKKDPTKTSGISTGDVFGKVYFAQYENEITPDYSLSSVIVDQYDKIDHTISDVRKRAIILCLIIALLSLLVSILLSNYITKSFLSIANTLEYKGKFGKLSFEPVAIKEFADLQEAICEYRKNLIQAHEDLNKAKAETLKAEAKTEAKIVFLGNVSHEFRTPMNGILGMLEVLRSTKLDEQQIECTDVIAESSGALLEIIDDMLDFSNLERGKLQIQNQKLRIREIVGNVNRLYQKRAAERNLQLKFGISPDTPNEAIGDATRITQVLSNLISNALKFTTQGEVTVSVSCKSQTPEECEIEFEVSDTGIGIESSKLNSIFTPFTQADETYTRKFGGTGLGLTISFRLAEMMGGSLRACSELGKGSTFNFRCPVKLERCQYSLSSS